MQNVIFYFEGIALPWVHQWQTINGCIALTTWFNRIPFINHYNLLFLQAGSYVLLYNVKALRKDNKISLIINNTLAFYYIIDEDVDQIKEMKR